MADVATGMQRTEGRSNAGIPWFFASLAVGGALVGAGYLNENPLVQTVLLTMACTLVFTVGMVVFRARREERAGRLMSRSVAEFIANDASPSFTTDVEGTILNANAAAKERFGNALESETLARAMRDLFANPASILTRLQSRAEARGAAREDVVTRKGHLRLAVHRVSESTYIWRLEDLVERGGAGRGADALSLPMLTASRSGTVLFMNDAMRRLVGGRVKSLDRVIRDLPVRPNSDHEIIGADGPVIARVVEVQGTGGRRELFLIPAVEGAPNMSEIGVTLGSRLDGFPVAVLKVSADGEIRQLNELARDLLGPDAIPGASLGGLVEGLGRSVRDWLGDAAQGRAASAPEIVKASHFELDRFVQITLGRVEEEGETSLLVVLHDATELKSLEAQFVQSQKMQAIGQLAGGVAHDFNNLLTAISGHCDLLLLRHDQGDPDYGDLSQINQNANRAASLVRQLLAFSRKQTLMPEVFDLSETMADVAHLLNRLVGEKVTLSVTHDPGLRPIRADKRQFEQVVMNLVVNARDAMPAGGEIRLETQAVVLREPMKRDRATVPAGDYTVVRVIDTGTGISPDVLSKIFEPFFSTKRPGEGTGLGLSTAYGIVKQTGGFIFADSVIDEGTTFSVFLPAYEGPAKPAPSPILPPRIENAMREDGVVLLVEDEAPVRAFASRALRLQGFKVIEAESAEEALDALKDKGLKIDVFVTDVIMPGMDGPTWVQLALKDRPDAKVVFVSGYAEDSFADAQSRIPNSVFLPKPFSLNDLTTTVQGQLH